MTPIWTENATRYLFNKEIRLNEQYTTFEGSRITLTNNHAKDIIKVVTFPKNRGAFVKRNK